MKNAKLSSKLLLLSLVLLAISVLIAWVGVSRLKVLDHKVEQMATQTVRKTILAGEMRGQLLTSIRFQKNANLTTSDEESEDFAAESRKTIASLQDQLKMLISSAENSEERALLNAFDLAVTDFVKTNNECLDLAVLNTNAKAKAELYGDATESLASSISLLNAVEATLLGSNEQPISASTKSAMSECERFASQLQQTFRLASQHIDTAVTDPKYKKLDQAVDELVELLPKGSDKIETICQAAAIPAEDLVRSVRSFRSSIAEVLRLSSVDSNNASVDISLTTARDTANVAVAAIDKLVDDYKSRIDTDVVQSKAIYDQSFLYILIACVGGIALGLWASFWISKSITLPIAMVRDVSRGMATGDLEKRIQLKQADEVGELASATDSLADALSSIVREIQKTSLVLADSSTNLGSISHGLVSQSEETSIRSSSVAAAAEELSTNINTMSAAAEQMSMNFSSISSATEELSASVGAISSAAEQTSSNVTNVANAVQSISGSFGDVLSDVREGAKVAGQASQMAESAGMAMRELDQSGSEISKFTETIKMIALQTNLLALNATIEATSAGEAGKGFAVVAHEIKELANQSAKAAEDIAKKIAGVQTGTRQAVGVISEIADVIKTINQSADRISHSVESQSYSAQTISHNIAEANKGVGHIARSISEVASTATHMSRNIAEASRAALDVSRNVGEAARASSGISESIYLVSAAAKQTNGSASGVTEAAVQLDQIAKELRNLISKFKVSGSGSA